MIGGTARRRNGGRLGVCLPRYRRTAIPPLLIALAACAGTNSTTERVTLPPGTPFGAVTDSLTSHGIVANRIGFKLLARVRGVDRAVQAGVYEFAPGVSPWAVLDILADGKAAAQRLTVPEGLTLDEVATLAAERLDLSRDSLLAAARDSAAASALLGYR
ncbi:MAG: endolytic transglycosylase MltG, partial [Gemmatimonadales bacterium]|nr:endolytic transglycosylase MltG [Gemmatimonadales bacterium]